MRVLRNKIDDFIYADEKKMSSYEREVLVDIGEPIDMGNYRDEYKANKTEACAKVTDRLFGEISAMLTKMENGRKPRYLD